MCRLQLLSALLVSEQHPGVTRAHEKRQTANGRGTPGVGVYGCELKSAPAARPAVVQPSTPGTAPPAGADEAAAEESKQPPYKKVKPNSTAAIPDPAPPPTAATVSS